MTILDLSWIFFVYVLFLAYINDAYFKYICVIITESHYHHFIVIIHHLSN